MSFLEEIKEIENDRNSRENIVVNDIVEYFKDKMYSDDFKNNLKNRIKEKIYNGEKTCDLKIEFWEYCSGCSYTNISVSGCGKFELKGINNDYDSYYKYKGVRLCDIHKKICVDISDMLMDRLRELDLKVVNRVRADSKYRYNYYVEKITISWE